MTQHVDELEAHAKRRLASGCEDMLLTVVRSREPRGNTVQLLPRQGPRGEIVRTMDNGDGRSRIAAYFKCTDVLAFIGLARAEHEALRGNGSKQDREA